MPINLNPVSKTLQQNDRVSAAWVFGSVATGKDRPDSDIDIAVLFIEGLDKHIRFDMRLAIAAELTDLTGRQVDVIDMQAAPLLLQHQVRRFGYLLFEKDHAYRVDFDVKSRREFLDFYPRLEKRNRQIINKVLEG
ncbi:MAG: type VII toxin-antitoxin system MntA family adenylyltransferase antitoxin [Syntrophomonadaceae bacterium]